MPGTTDTEIEDSPVQSILQLEVAQQPYADTVEDVYPR